MREPLTASRTTTQRVPHDLTRLVYELLDAHDDTVQLAHEGAVEEWQWHLRYLRDLQRVGREILADSTAP